MHDQLYPVYRCPFGSPVTPIYLGSLGNRSPTIFDWSHEACELMLHFLDGSGSEVGLPMKQILSQDDGIWAEYKSSLDSAVAFVNSLQFVESLEFIESKATLGTSSSDIWRTAIGNFTGWGAGEASATLGPDGKLTYSLEFTYKLWDPYDWNPGGGAFPARLANLHLEGLAQQFLMTGTYRTTLTWKEGGPLPTAARPYVSNPYWFLDGRGP